MPQAQISDFAFEYLQKRAVPLVDTFATVLDRILHEHQVITTEADQTSVNGNKKVFKLHNLPSVKFTTIHDAEVGGKAVERSWNHILEEMISACGQAGASPHQIKSVMNANIKEGNHNDNGFRYVAEVGFSFQGLEANRASREILKLADKFKVPVTIQVFWQQKEKAAFPGAEAIIRGGA